MKRLVDILASVIGLILAAPVLLPCMLLIYLGDRHSPFYIAERVGRADRPFRMVKLRSMVVNADQSGVDSTAASDERITRVGRFIRRSKLDELTQLLNVLAGDMSIVGPRPNVERETGLYTLEESRLLTVRPGITDLASIVFSDEGEVLAGSDDPDLRYNQLIRPWKSRLGLLYVDNAALALDLRIMWLTAVGMVSRPRALKGVAALVREFGGGDQLSLVSARVSPLEAAPPPGATQIVHSRSNREREFNGSVPRVAGLDSDRPPGGPDWRNKVDPSG
jgi:lipopolysaccharide/colanic/teichoic acid biosynthesis glycosyltransferase